MACLADGADQTIDFAALPALTYGHAPLQLTATASSGLSVSFASSDETAVQIREKDGVWTATVFRSGTITITASQSGDANWNAAPEVARDLVVASRAVPERELSQLAAFEAGTTIVGFASGDVDGDGVPELLVGLDNGKAKVLTYSDGAFTELAELEVGAGHVDGMIVADADGDEENEIVALHNNGDAGGGMAVFEYRPDTASFEKVWSVAKNTPRMGRGPAVGDIDADGSPEIVLPVSWYTRRAYVYRAAAENDYQEVSSFGASCDWSDAVVADTTGDGLLETVLTTSENPSGDHLYIRKWDGAAYQQTSLDVGSLAQCAVGDLTGDGVADIVATSPELRFQSSVSPGLRLVSHLGSTYEILAEHQPGTGVSHPRVGDLLGAGLPAVSVRNATGDSVLLWTGSEFAEVAQLENGDGTVPMDKRDTCIVDFDGDLVAEWVVQNAARTGLLVYQLLPPNTAPVGVDDTYETVQNMALEVPAPGILANDSDAEGDALTAVKATDPAHGTLAFAEDGSFTYTPTADYVGEDTFTYTVNDGRADSASTTVTIDVFDPDTDDDQLPDEWEIEHFGNLDQGADDDSDVDAATNAQEYAGGTDPMDPLSVPGLVAYYPLDSDAADVTGNGHDGTVDAAVAFGTTACGSAALLSGDHGGIEVPHSADLSFGEESFSLSVAFQVGADDLAGMEGSLMALVSKFLETGGWDARWRLAMLDDGRVQFLWSSLITLDRTITTESSYADGGWHHVVVVIDRDSTPPYPRIYVDGVEATVTRDGSGSSLEDALNGSIDNSVSLFIGQDTYYKDQDFQGAIDDVRLYGRGLGQREISALADAYSLVAYYPLDSDATDATGNGNDGAPDASVVFETDGKRHAAVFSGDHGGIEVAHSADLDFGTDSFSVATAFVTGPEDIGGHKDDMALVSRFLETPGWDARWRLGLHVDGRLYFHWSNDITKDREIASEGSYADGLWHHVCVVVDRQTSPPYPRLYVDGREVEVTRDGSSTSVDALEGALDNTESLFIGQDTYYKEQAFQGAIDDVRLYGRGLSVSEVSALGASYSLVARYPLDSDAADVTGNGHDGTVDAAVAFGTTAYGSAALFSGDHGGIEVPHSADLSFGEGSFSLSVAFQVGADDLAGMEGSLMALVSKFLETGGWDARWRLAMLDDGRVQFLWSSLITLDRTITTESSYADGGWHHVVVVIDRDSTPPYPRIYVDGVEATVTRDGSGSSPEDALNGSIDNSVSLFIGQDTYYKDQDFQGAIDDVRLYGRVLGQREISALADAYSLVAYYPLDSDATDVTGNGHDGTADSAVAFGTTAYGSAAVFSGNHGGIEVAHSADLNFGEKSFSVAVACQVSPDELDRMAGPLMALVSKFQGTGYYPPRWYLSMMDDGRLRFLWCNSTTQTRDINTELSYADGRWHHVVVVVDRDSSPPYPRLYVDGTEAAVTRGGGDYSTDALAGSIDNSVSLFIGQDTYYKDQAFQGAIDDVRLYGRGLSVSEISALADAYSLVPTHTVSFDLGAHGTRTGGGELTQTIDHGDAATEPTFTVEVGWTFTGWDTAFDNVTDDLTATAQYAVTTYTVAFDLGDHGTRTGGGELTQTINHGDAATEPTFTVQGGWTFTGWDTAFANVTADLTATAQYSATGTDPFGDPVVYPNTAMTILVQVSRSQGEAEEGDVVGAFVDGELRGKASVLLVDGVPYANLTVNVDAEGEAITLKLYDASANATEDGNRTVAGAAATSLGTPTDPVEVVFGLATLDIELAAGWNQVSLNLRPTDPTCDASFAGISSVLQKAIGGGGNYTPGWGALNTLTRFEDGLGYWVKVSAATTWTVEGILLDAASTPIDLSGGWNHIAFVGPSASTVDGALAGISGVLQKVIGDGGNYTPGWGALNTLTTMEPGIGYWVKVSSGTTLTYGFAAPSSRATASMDRAAPGWAAVQPDPPATAHLIVACVTLDGEPVVAGSKLGVFVNDQCRAVGDVIDIDGDSFFNLTVLMGTTGETAEFRLYDATGDVLLDTDFTTTLMPGGSDGTPTEPVDIGFSSPVVQHTVTFKPGLHGDLDGGTPDVIVAVADGDPVPTAPAVTAAEGWVHVGWDWVSARRGDAPTAITGDWAVTALYEEDAPAPAAWQLELVLDGAVPGTLSIGMRPDATDGWDAGVDEQYPLPAPGQACFASGDLALSYAADYHALAETGEFLLLVSASDDAPATVAWDASGLPEGKFLSIYEVTLGAVSPNRADVPRGLVGNTGLNMALAESLAVPAGETRSYVVTYGDELVFDLRFEAGWNLISLPIEPSSPALDVVLSDGQVLRDGFRGTIYSGSVCTWSSQGYADVTELHACTGYWIHVPEAQVIPVAGQPASQTQLGLARGWNQCGVEAECEVPADGRIVGTPWVWNPLSLRYEAAQTLRPGVGFWINVSEEATIQLDGDR